MTYASVHSAVTAMANARTQAPTAAPYVNNHGLKSPITNHSESALKEQHAYVPSNGVELKFQVDVERPNRWNWCKDKI
jgi:hypothetical protein